MDASATTEAATKAAPTATELDAQPPPKAALTLREKRIANLKRYPKGTRPPTLASGRVGPNVKSLEALIRKTLRAGSYAALEALARAIVKDAISGDPASKNAARALLVPRLWPILEDAGQSGKVILQSITIEGGGQLHLAPNPPSTQSPELSERIVELEQKSTD